LYEWREDTVLLGTGAVLTDTLAVGMHQIVLLVTDKYGKTDADTVMINILADPTSSEKTSGLQRNIEVFPNPAVDGRISLRLNGFEPGDHLHIELLNITGKSVYHSTLQIQPGTTWVLHLQDHDQGLYLLRISNPETFIIRKIFIK
jgi:hypothetical protein